MIIIRFSCSGPSFTDVKLFQIEYLAHSVEERSCSNVGRSRFAIFLFFRGGHYSGPDEAGRPASNPLAGFDISLGVANHPGVGEVDVP